MCPVVVGDGCDSKAFCVADKTQVNWWSFWFLQTFSLTVPVLFWMFVTFDLQSLLESRHSRSKKKRAWHKCSVIYRAVCDMKGAWDANLSHDPAKLWVKWKSRLPELFTVLRSRVAHREEIERIDLHSFGDVCAHGVAACIYAVIWQASGTNQGLIAARSRLAKQGLTILQLELVAGHMAVNLVDNVRDALDGLHVRSTHCWLDSSVALCWIQGQGGHKQFVANRVQKINSQIGGMAPRTHSR